MATDLPRIHVLLQGPSPRALASRKDAVAPDELRNLVSMDVTTPDAGPGPIDRVYPLNGRRWAVGRRTGHRAVWRIIDAEVAARLSHPAWLWTSDPWFDPRVNDAEPAPLPNPEGLRTLLRQSAAMGGSRRQSVKCIAAVVAALRQGGRKGVALVVPPATLSSASHTARWFGLALLHCLPPSVRESLRIGIGERAPDPRWFDLVVTDHAPDGFRIIDASEAPDEGRDLVAFFLRNRLHANDPEAVEEAAWRFDQPAKEDAWGDGIRQIILAGTPGVSIVTQDMLERDPEGSVRALRARVRAGAPLNEGLIASLVEVTVRTGDHRPWRPLVVRSAVERAAAVQALLERKSELDPKRELVEVLGGLVPRGSSLQAWCSVLIAWIKRPALTETALDILVDALTDWPSAATKASRGTVFGEAVAALVEAERHELAAGALGGPLARQIAADGGARVVIHAWQGMPRSERTDERRDGILSCVADAPDREPALAMLYRATSDDAREVRSLVRAWRRVSDGPIESDPLYLALYRGGASREWIRAELEGAPPEGIGAVVASLTDDPLSPLWVEAEELQATALGGSARDRFLRLGQFGEGLPALDHLGLSLVPHLLLEASFPDSQIGELATAFATTAETSRTWGLVAMASCPVGTFDDDTTDATLVDFLEHPPKTVEEQQAAFASIRGLADSPGADPVDLARWIVRCSLAPSSQELAAELALELVQAIARRADGEAHLAAVTTAFADVPDDHPAVAWLAAFLIPQAWISGVPDTFLELVEGLPAPAAVRYALRLSPSP